MAISALFVFIDFFWDAKGCFVLGILYFIVLLVLKFKYYRSNWDLVEFCKNLVLYEVEVLNLSSENIWKC